MNGGFPYEKNSDSRDVAAGVCSVGRRAEFYVAKHSGRHQRPERTISEQQQPGAGGESNAVHAINEPVVKFLGEPGAFLEHAIQQHKRPGKHTECRGWRQGYG